MDVKNFLFQTENKIKIKMDETKPKTFEELNALYEQAKKELNNNNGDRVIAKQHFEPVLTYIDEMLKSNPKTTQDESANPIHLRLITIKGLLLYEQSKMMTPTCKDSALQAFELLEPYKTNPSLTHLYFRVLNYLAYHLTKTEQFDEAKILLENAEQLYNTFPKGSKFFLCSIDDQFRNDDDDESLKKTDGNNQKFEKLVTNNMQLLAWIYNKKNMVEKFVQYHHMVLRRQLELQDGNAFSWVFKCVQLGSYFFCKQKFREARHLLSAACSILYEYEIELMKHRHEPYFNSDWNSLQHYIADMGRYWIKYGLQIFHVSKKHCSDEILDKLLINSFGDKKVVEEKTEQPETEKKNSEEKLKETEEKTTEYEYIFPSLMLQTQEIEMQVTASPVKSSDEARNLFLFVQNWLKRSKSYYNVKKHPTDYVELILDLNELYSYLSFYESDFDIQYDIQKRRADILETLCTILKEVVPYFYLSIGVELLREISLVQIELVNLNMKRIMQSDSKTESRQNEALVRIRSRLNESITPVM